MALIYLSLLLLAALADHPRLHVEGRSLGRDADAAATTTEKYDELTTDAAIADAVETTVASLAESIRETTTAASGPHNNGITLDISRYTSPPNRSLYDELKAEEEAHAVTSQPQFTPSDFDSFASTEMFERLTNAAESDESTEMSLESAFNESESDFRNNATKEERHQIDEVRMDEKSVMYSSQNQSLPGASEEEADATTVAPSTKKGKYLELMPPGEDNMNASLPNTAEVWALAGMLDVEARKRSTDDDSSNDVELINGHMNDTVKSLLDWTEIAKMDNETTTVAASTVKAIVSDTKSQLQLHNHRLDEPATAENKEVAVSTAAVVAAATTTSKSPIEDNRLELEHENAEFSANKSRIDADVLGAKSSEESVDVELLPLNHRNDNGKSQTNERLTDRVTERESSTAYTTPSLSLLPDEDATTVEVESAEVEPVASTTMSSGGFEEFTVIGEDESGEIDTDDNVVAKRTITETPDIKTEEFTTSTPVPSSTPVPTSTLATTTFVDIPTTVEPKTVSFEKFNRSIMVTKSISMRLATTITTEQPDELDSTTASSESSESYYSSTTEKYDDYTEALSSVSPSSSTPVEITDDDKFKYNTLLPDTTSFINLLDTSRAGKSGTVAGTEVNDTDLSKENLGGQDAGNNVAIISISISVVVFILLAAGGFLLFKKRKKQLTYGQRCRPVGLDAYSLDNVSVFNSVRRKANALRLSKRSYGNSAFEDPSLQSNVLDYQSLQDFAKNKTSIHDEFKEIPQVTVRVEEVPENCEDKNRYANVVPLPETRVHLQRVNDDEKTEYINANYVKGPKDSTNYYIATQAPLEATVPDFWRMIWEQNSKVIVMITDLTENGVERCAEYIPASVVLDNSSTFGDYQVTLKSREVKGKYAVSQLHLKNLKTNTWREIMHLWYSWPENGCPTDDASVIAMLLEARSYLRTSLPEQLDENSNAENNNNVNDKEKLSTLDKTKSLQRIQGPLTVHCSPGTGRTGTIIACDIVLRMLETPPRQIDIPQIVYQVRRGRANAVRTKDQYEFIYGIANAYAIKLNTAPAET